MKFKIIFSTILSLCIVQLYAQDESQEKKYTIEYKMEFFGSAYHNKAIPFAGITRYEVFEDKIHSTFYEDSLFTSIISDTTIYLNQAAEADFININQVETVNHLDSFFNSNQEIYHLTTIDETFGSYIQLSDIQIDFLFGESTQNISENSASRISTMPDYFIQRYQKLPRIIALQFQSSELPYIDLNFYLLYQLDSFTDHR